MENKVLKFVLCGALLLAGCSKGPAGPTATVTLRDGTNVTGVVTKTDTSGITLVTAAGQTQMYPTTQIDSISYASAAGATGATSVDTTASTAPAPVAPVPASSPSSAPPPPPPASSMATSAPAPVAEPTRDIPAGTRIQVRNSDRIQAGEAEIGQTFPAVVVSDVVGTDGGVAIRKGSDATLVVRASHGQGKMQGRSEIALDLASVRVRGHRYNLETRDIVEEGTQGVGKNKRSAKFIGGGAALGAIIGAVAGGGKGAAIGAAAGAGGGVAAQSLTRGKAVSVPSESILDFALEQGVQIRLVN